MASEQRFCRDDPDLVLLVKGRNGHPDLFLAPNHPFGAKLSGRVIITDQDTSEEGLDATWADEQTKKTPKGNLEDHLQNGWFRLQSGDMLAVRSTRGNRDPLKDVPVVWVVGRTLVPQTLVDEYERARDSFLGPDNLRTGSRPVVSEDDDGNRTLKGGIAFERTPMAKGVNGGRAYTLGPSFEKQTKNVAPVASLKASSEDYDAEELGEFKGEFIKASTAIAVHAIELGPDGMLDAMKAGASVRNVPAYGVDDNHYFGTTQVNVAAAQRPAAKDHTLFNDHKFFGGAHHDRGDSVGHYTSMTDHSVLPSNYTPGFFFLHGLGVFVVLEPLLTVVFTGLRQHGGTSPLSPEGEEIELDITAVRLTAVTYPPGALMNGMGRLIIAAWPDGKPFYIPPEVIYAGIKYLDDKGVPLKAQTKRTTWIVEGQYLMSRVALATFIIRCLMLLIYFVIQQFPPSLEVRFHADRFESAFDFVEDGERRQVDPWDMAPGFRKRDAKSSSMDTGNDGIPEDNELEDGDEKRTEAMKQWYEYSLHHAQHIPSTGGYIKTPFKFFDLSEPKPAMPNKRKSGRAAKTAAMNKANRPQRKSASKKARKSASKSPRKSSKKGMGSNGDDDEYVDQGSDVEMGNGEAIEVDEVVEQDEDLGDSDMEVEEDVPLSLRSQKHAREETGLTNNEQHENEDEDEDVAECRQQHDEWTQSLLCDEPDKTSPDIAAAYSQHIPFVERLTLERLQKDIDELQDVLVAVTSDSLPSVHAQSNVEQTIAALARDPASRSVASMLTTLWTNINSLNTNRAIDTFRLRMTRVSIMLSNYFAWNWLYDFCRGTVVNWMRSGASAENWIQHLAKNVKNALESRTKMATFDPTTYMLEISSKPFEYSNQKRRIYPVGPELDNAVVYWTLRIITEWFQYPENRASRWQAFFVSSILAAFGQDALLLNVVWDGYQNVHGRVIGDSRATAHVLQRFRLLDAQLGGHPLCQEGSAENVKLATVVEIVKKIQNPAGQSIGIPPNPIDKHTLPALAAPTPLPHPHLPLPNISLRVSELQLRRLADFGNFIDEAIQVAIGRDDGKKTKWKDALRRFPDSLVPFRNLGPSAKRAYEADGPYSSANARSSQGFYSALNFRGILFNSHFSRYGWLLHADHNDFLAAKQELADDYQRVTGNTPPENVFCNQAAYGPANRHRTIELAAVYAKNVPRHDFLTLLEDAQHAGRSSIPFARFWT
uniref:Uncharacterized protein n=1 Tax=Mycena chlorophos TaxID=658473 RepID=A0ABQ0LAV4_MYCCL|nr:predicted protein [Mycena chlorophos]